MKLYWRYKKDGKWTWTLAKSRKKIAPPNMVYTVEVRLEEEE